MKMNKFDVSPTYMLPTACVTLEPDLQMFKYPFLDYKKIPISILSESC